MTNRIEFVLYCMPTVLGEAFKALHQALGHVPLPGRRSLGWIFSPLCLSSMCAQRHNGQACTSITTPTLPSVNTTMQMEVAAQIRAGNGKQGMAYAKVKHVLWNQLFNCLVICLLACFWNHIYTLANQSTSMRT